MTDDRERRFFLLLRRAFLMVVRWIEDEYDIRPAEGEERRHEERRLDVTRR